MASNLSVYEFLDKFTREQLNALSAFIKTYSRIPLKSHLTADRVYCDCDEAEDFIKYLGGLSEKAKIISLSFENGVTSATFTLPSRIETGLGDIFTFVLRYCKSKNPQGIAIHEIKVIPKSQEGLYAVLGGLNDIDGSIADAQHRVTKDERPDGVTYSLNVAEKGLLQLTIASIQQEAAVLVEKSE